MALANSLALRLAGVTRDTQGPGRRHRSCATLRGEPTGLLKDNAMELVSRAIPEPSREVNLRAARAALEEAARVGVTTIQDNSADGRAAHLPGPARAAASSPPASTSGATPSSRSRPLKQTGVRTGLGDDWIRLGALKILSDGSMGSGTAAFFEPFTDDPTTKGCSSTRSRSWSRPSSRPTPRASSSPSTPSATAPTPRARRLREGGRGQRPPRPPLPHRARAARPGAKDIARYKALGVIASIQPSHCIDDMRFADERASGRERCPRRLPVALLRGGGRARGLRHGLVRGAARSPARPLRRRDARAPRGRPSGRLRARGEDRASRRRSTPTRAARPTRSSRRRTRGRWRREARRPRGLRARTSSRCHRGRSWSRPST